jgi:hypothetical protein
MTAFMLEARLGEVTCRIVDEFANERSASKRDFQTGVAAELYVRMFGHVPDSELHHLFQSVLRFAGYDDPQSRLLGKAFWATSKEMPIQEWSAYGKPVSHTNLAAFIRSVLRRICDWVDAFSHAQMHAFSHWAPVAFDPDPEKRELALLGFQHRGFHAMTDFQKTWWQWHHQEASERLSDPAKWSMVGKGMTSEATTLQNYPALDEAVILFWPLMLKHHWTYRDMANVLRSVAPSPISYPCEREQDLATYCANVLGLRKKGKKGKTTKDGLPPGSEIARALCGKDADS